VLLLLLPPPLLLLLLLLLPPPLLLLLLLPCFPSLPAGLRRRSCLSGLASHLPAARVQAASWQHFHATGAAATSESWIQLSDTWGHAVLRALLPLAGV
jgi:hypothetical protein